MYKALDFTVCRHMLSNFFNLSEGKLAGHNHALCAEAVPEIACCVVRVIGLGRDVNIYLGTNLPCDFKHTGVRNNKSVGL